MVSALRILFVCMGNICRSPLAEGVGRGLAQRIGLAARIEFSSAGTLGSHAGEAPDERAQRVAARRGYDISRQRARQVEVADFQRFDRIFAMDRANLAALQRICPPEHHGKLALLLDCAGGEAGREVPDPYYGNEAGFENVLDLCEAAVQGLIAGCAAQHGAPFEA